jgi:hypothetical protein
MKIECLRKYFPPVKELESRLAAARQCLHDASSKRECTAAEKNTQGSPSDRKKPNNKKRSRIWVEVSYQISCP